MNYRDDIKAYLDGELPAARMEEMRLAIEADPSLKTEADEMAKIAARIQSMAKVPPVQGLDRAVALMRSRPTWTSRNWTWAVPALAFVTIAAGMTAFNGPSMVAMSEARSMEKALPSAAASPPASEGVTMASPVEPQAGSAKDLNSNYSTADTDARTKSTPTTGNGGVSADNEESLFGFADQAVDGSSTERTRVTRGGVGTTGGTGTDTFKKGAREPEFAEVDPGLVPELADRNVIRDANLTVQVEDARKAKDNLIQAIEDVRGFVESSDLQASEEGATAHIRAQVPVAEFTGVITKAKAMGFVVSENQTGEDVTLRIVDANSRVKTYRTQEEQYRLMLSKAKTTGEILAIKEKLSNVRATIESWEAQRAKLQKLADLSTLNATLEQKKPVAESTTKKDGWAGESWNSAVGRFDSVWRVVATFLMNLLTLAPFWLPAAILIWWYRAKLAKTA
jgi:hypothetical protein